MILLHTTKYGDSSLILHGYTREEGRESFILRSVGKKGKSAAMGVLHPLNILSVEVAPRSKNEGNSSLKYIREYSSKYVFHSLRSNIYKNSIVLYISELLYKTLRTPEQDTVLYDFIEHSVVTLDGCEGNFSNFHIWFTVNYVALMGFFPSEGFSLEYNPFSEREVENLCHIAGGSLEETLSLTFNGNQRTHFVSAVIKYLEFHLGVSINLKSLSILHSVFE